MANLFLAVFVLFGTPSYASTADDTRDMAVSCAIINGKINNAAKCNELQKKQLEAMCDKNDPNACKALKVARVGRDELALEEQKKVQEKKTTQKIVNTKQDLRKEIKKKQKSKKQEVF
jgi:hypothetical protein